GPTTTAADLAATAELLPAGAPEAAAASVAFMELGAVVCTARNPRCLACPLASGCAWRAGGRTLPPGPTRRPQRYAGTDRQVRGKLLAVLREATGPVPASRLERVWHDTVQRDPALASLVADGLVWQPAPQQYALAGDAPGEAASVGVGRGRPGGGTDPASPVPRRRPLAVRSPPAAASNRLPTTRTLRSAPRPARWRRPG